MAEPDKIDFMKVMMTVYDLATELAPQEGKTHRETFRLICEYIDIEARLSEKKKY
ncbi:unnamed protein product [marine sediment metagenome]|uniref:Uncharacterized protein n=1 Tax=marine sediment metagenome TaxID=412755 RepID=X1S0H4_9ZZZZ